MTYTVSNPQRLVWEVKPELASILQSTKLTGLKVWHTQYPIPRGIWHAYSTNLPLSNDAKVMHQWPCDHGRYPYTKNSHFGLCYHSCLTNTSCSLMEKWRYSIYVLNSCVHFFSFQNKEDLDLCVREHMSYGKGFMKSCKVCLSSVYIYNRKSITQYEIYFIACYELLYPLQTKFGVGYIGITLSVCLSLCLSVCSLRVRAITSYPLIWSG